MSDNTYIDWYMEKRKLQQEIEKQRKEICDKTDEIQKLQSEITDMCHDVFELQAGVKELKNENNQLRARVMELEASNEELLELLEFCCYRTTPGADCWCQHGQGLVKLGHCSEESYCPVWQSIQKARGQG